MFISECATVHGRLFPDEKNMSKPDLDLELRLFHPVVSASGEDILCQRTAQAAAPLDRQSLAA